MKRMILCEGKTDAILISYFLIKKFGWRHIKTSVQQPAIKLPVQKDNEEFNWYTRDDRKENELAIWGVGGKDVISVKFSEVVQRNRVERQEVNRFGHIVIPNSTESAKWCLTLTRSTSRLLAHPHVVRSRIMPPSVGIGIIFLDRDTQSEAECSTWMEEWIRSAGAILSQGLQFGLWLDASQQLATTPSQRLDMRLLAIALPPDKPGNLETFLIDALKAQSREDGSLIDNAESFIAGLPDEPYLSKRRLRSKAHLGVVLSVMSPDWVFSMLNERLTRVGWERLDYVMQAYGKLKDL